MHSNATRWASLLHSTKRSLAWYVVVCAVSILYTPVGDTPLCFQLSDMATGIEASRLLTHKAAWMADNGIRNSHVASMAKVTAGEHCQKVCSDAVQIFGGNGFNTGYPVEKLLRDSKIYSIYGACRDYSIACHLSDALAQRGLAKSSASSYREHFSAILILSPRNPFFLLTNLCPVIQSLSCMHDRSSAKSVLSPA
jgi:hypothetical protein